MKTIDKERKRAGSFRQGGALRDDRRLRLRPDRDPPSRMGAGSGERDAR